MPCPDYNRSDPPEMPPGLVVTVDEKGTAPSEGIVSKKLGSRYEFGRFSLWLETINPSAPALLRLEQEDWRG